jgi:hypothetical protein
MRTLRKTPFVAAGGLVASLLAASAPARAAELDAQGHLQPSSKDAILIGFEDAAELAGLSANALRWSGSSYNATVVRTPVLDGSVFVGRALPPSLAPQGSTALHVGGQIGDGTVAGIELPAAPLLTRLGTKRLSVSVWVRAEGDLPQLALIYARPDRADFFARVYAQRTGRETSDGWAELSTGPVDAAIWGVPLARIQVGLGPYAAPEDAGGIDALEITPLDGEGGAPKACTQADVDVTCGADADCQFGHCVPGYAVWGALPPASHRKDLVDRWLHLATHVQGDRHAADNAASIMAVEGPKLATAPGGTRAFHAGVQRLVNLLRDHHTSFGGPGNGGVFQPYVGNGSSSVGACFGPGQLDLLATSGPGELGYVVYRAAPSAISGVALMKGDALTAIDGKKPLDWVRDVWVANAGSVPSDPAADLGWSATSVATLVAKRASTIEITRCDSDARCDGGHRRVLTIDVAGPAYAKIVATGALDTPGAIGCSVRFQNSIEQFAPRVRGEDSVSGQIVRGDVLAIQFDGTYGATQWSASMRALFEGAATPPTKVLFDTRQGNGGYSFNSETVADLIRPASQPVGYVDVAIGDWQNKLDFAALSPTYPRCEESAATSNVCIFTSNWFLSQTAPIAGGARVAFLGAADVSANDYLARLVQGRQNQRVFAPCPTSGAFGSISSIPPMLQGWYGGSIQMQDSRWGTSLAGLATEPWQSGHGIPPDEYLAEKMSDAIDDRDTMVEAAHAWLRGGP